MSQTETDETTDLLTRAQRWLDGGVCDGCGGIQSEADEIIEALLARVERAEEAVADSVRRAILREALPTTDGPNLLTPAGNALHRSRYLMGIEIARCNAMAVISRRRTADHAALIAAGRHPICKRCAKESP